MPTIDDIRKFVKLGYSLGPSNARVLLARIEYLEAELRKLKG